jgi:hypothetical protein
MEPSTSCSEAVLVEPANPEPGLLPSPDFPGQDVPDDPALTAGGPSMLGLVDLVLKAPHRLDALAREERQQAGLIPRFLVLALMSFGIHALALSLVLSAVPVEDLPPFLRERWSRSTVGPALSLGLAYTLGLVAATGVCLPSFYFFGLLSGIRISALQVTSQVLKGKTCTAVMLVGTLPVYAAVALGLIVFGISGPVLRAAVWLGLALPFLAGLYGLYAIYRGLLAYADTLPPERRCRRTCFLRRLTLAWAGCYTAVSPVMIYRLWEVFADRLP